MALAQVENVCASIERHVLIQCVKSRMGRARPVPPPSSCAPASVKGTIFTVRR